MGLMDALRHAEQEGKRAARQGAERLKTGIQNAGAGILHAAQTHCHDPEPPASVHPDPEQGKVPSPKVRTGIVSVNGQDVGEMQCPGGRRTSQ